MNKKTLTLMLVLTTMFFQNIFALKIPTGDSIRVLDIKEDGDSIIEVVVGGEEPQEITTPIGKLKARVGSTLYFYKSGALQKINLPDEGQKIETPIGTLSLSNVTDSYYGTSYCEFYESGSPKFLYLKGRAEIKINDYIYGVSYSEETKNPIVFYDSGSSEVFQVKKIRSTELYRNGKWIDYVTYTNKSGTFDIYMYNHPDYEISFYRDGSIKSARLKTSPKTPVMIYDNEVFIKGDNRISFYEDGSVAEFVSADLCMATINDLKLKIPAGNQISLWNSGNIKKCYINNDLSFDLPFQPKKEYDKTQFWFNDDGTLKGFYCEYGYINAINEDGSISIVEYDINWDTHELELRFANIFNTNGERYIKSVNGIYNQAFTFRYLFQDENEVIGAVYFDDEGKPRGYSTVKRDEDGNIIFDDFDVPVPDEEIKQFSKIESGYYGK